MRAAQRKFVDGLVDVVGRSQAVRPEQDRSTRHFVDGLVSRIRRHQAEQPRPSADRAAFRRVIVDNWDSLRWRIAGAIAWEARQLDSESLNQLRVLEDHPSLLRPLNKTRDEVSHTTLFGWLLSDEGAMGLAARAAFAAWLHIDVRQTGWVVRTESVIGPGCRIDIEIEVPGQWLCYVEAKIDAEERANQLAEYKAILAAEADARGVESSLVFLTPEGRRGQHGDHTPMSFRDLLVMWLPVAATVSDISLACWLVTLAEDLCEVSAPGPFSSWPFANQKRALALLRDITEVR